MKENQRPDRRIYAGTDMAEILIREGFTRFTADQIGCYEKYLHSMNGPTGSYMRVANILCWGFYSIPYIREYRGFALIVNDDAYYRRFSVLMPVGDYENTEGLASCLRYVQELMAKLETECVFLQAKEWMRPYLERVKGLSFSWEYKEAESDYIYPLAKMKESMDRRHVHYGEKIWRFQMEFDPVLSLYRPEQYQACLEIIRKQHCNLEGCKGCVFGCMEEWFALLTDHLEDLHAEIHVISSQGKVIAFITMVRDEDLLYFDRKATHDLPGLTEYLNRFIVDTWYPEFEIMNFEEDMGVPGLRRHKKALGPHELSHNYSLRIEEIKK